jgi:hypothetical protein
MHNTVNNHCPKTNPDPFRTKISFIHLSKKTKNTPELTFGLLRAGTHSYGQLQAHISTSKKEKKKYCSEGGGGVRWRGLMRNIPEN